MVSLFLFNKISMISTKNLFDISEIPIEWIFEHYLNLSEKLDGQDIKIRSVFKLEKTPSMCVYYDVNCFEYRFKDFSSGYQGNGINLVKYLFNIEYHEGIVKIENDYSEFIKYNIIHVPTEIKAYDRFKVTDFQIRHWNNLDEYFWRGYKINSNLLAYYNVSPLEYFTMSKEETDGTPTIITTSRNYLYGYFRDDGTLYKIYLPRTPDKKFVKVENYIQGVDQLVGKDYLIITSSLKDLMAFTRLGIQNAESIAPDSENSMIAESVIIKLKAKYKKVIVLFDNDEAGKASMLKYKERYNLDFINLGYEKDLSDTVKAHGVDFTRDVLLKLIKKVI